MKIGWVYQTSTNDGFSQLIFVGQYLTRKLQNLSMIIPLHKFYFRVKLKRGDKVSINQEGILVKQK
jgi:hypothetical protein